MSETVYLAYYGYNYEGGEVIGVYSTRDKAENALEANTSRFADFFDVKEVAIDTEAKIGI